MTCTEARELLSLRHDGIAVPDTLDGHLAVCPSCRNYEKLLSAAFEKDDTPAPASLMENVMSRIENKPSPDGIRRRKALRVWLPVTAAAACAALVISLVPAVTMKAGSAAPDTEAPEAYAADDAMECCAEEAAPEMPAPAEESKKSAPQTDAAEDAVAEEEMEPYEYCAEVTGPVPEDIPWEEHEDGSRTAYFTPSELRKLEEAGAEITCGIPLDEIPDDVLVETVWDGE